MPWLQFLVKTQREDVERVENAMLAHGALSVSFEDNADEPIFEPALGETPLWSNTRVTGLFDSDIDTQLTQNKILGDCRQPENQVLWQILEDKDWQREWMQYFHPIQCGTNFWICPSWTPPPVPTAINLMLDPGLAFGTGTHPTTYLCLQWIAEQNLQGKTVIDYGCGSGILGIAALLHGAKRVIGIDIDRQALAATKENVLRNGLSADSFPVYLPQNAPSDTSDFVFANILAGPLVALKNTLTELTEDNGKLCLSGILATQTTSIVAAYEQAYNIDNIDQQEEWVRITATKKHG